MNFIIQKSSNEKGTYYTIINPSNGFHTHAKNYAQVQRVVRAAQKIEKGYPVREANFVKCKAMRLFIAGKKLEGWK